MRRLKFTIEYDGRNYCGWQRQLSFPSIQQTIEEKLQQITQKHSSVVGSGRTDSGVHAWGQVAHTDVDTALDDQALKKALNSILPEDIIIRELETADQGFHAQRDVEHKTYIYQLYPAKTASPLLRNQSWRLPMNVDLKAMNEAAQLIIGEHDFKAFQNQGSTVKTTVRKILKSEFHEASPYLIYEVCGTGFLKQMVRNLVNCFVMIGKGKLTLAQFQAFMRGRDRTQSPPPAPPYGLFLKEVHYRVK